MTNAQETIKNMSAVELSGALKLVGLQTLDSVSRELINRAASLLATITDTEYEVVLTASNALRFKIQSIKFVRQCIFGMTLKGAKDSVEAGDVVLFRGRESGASDFLMNARAVNPDLNLEMRTSEC